MEGGGASRRLSQSASASRSITVRHTAVEQSFTVLRFFNQRISTISCRMEKRCLCAGLHEGILSREVKVSKSRTVKSDSSLFNRAIDSEHAGQ